MNQTNKKRIVSVSLMVLVIVGAVALFGPSTVLGANGIVRVQGNARGTVSGSSPISVVFGAAPTRGNVIVMVVGGYGNGQDLSVSSVTQTGVTWTSQVVNDVHLSYSIELWLGVVGAGASTTITVNLTGYSSGRATANACEYSGVATSGFLDKTATSGPSSGQPSTTGTTAATSQASELWVGGVVWYGSPGQSSPTNGFALLDGAYANPVSVSYLEKIVSSTGTASSGTSANTSGWSGVIATFKGVSPSRLGAPSSSSPHSVIIHPTPFNAEPTVLTATSNAQSYYSHDHVTVTVSLTFQSDGAPLGNRAILVTFGTDTQSVTTDGNGLATATFTAPTVTQDTTVQFSATFMGD